MKPSYTIMELALVAALAFALGGLLFVSTPNADSIGDWVYRFQALIAGSLALVAAFITVWQMRRSDEQSHERHRQILELQLLRPKTLFDRLVQNWVGLIEAKFEEYDRQLECAAEDVQLANMAVGEMTDWLDAMSGIARWVEDRLKDPEIVDAENLMSARLHIAYLQAKDASKGLADALNRRSNGLATSPNQPTGVNAIQNSRDKLRSLRKDLGSIAVEARAQAKLLNKI